MSSDVIACTFLCMFVYETLIAIDGLEIGFVSMGLVLMPVTLFLYTRANARKDAELRKLAEGGEKYTPNELRRMGDRAPDFRYTL